MIKHIYHSKTVQEIDHKAEQVNIVLIELEKPKEAIK